MEHVGERDEGVAEDELVGQRGTENVRQTG